MNKLVTRLIASLFLVRIPAAAPAQEAASPRSSWSSTCGRRKRRTGLGLLPQSGKCNKDVFRIADVASDPLKVEALQAGSLAATGARQRRQDAHGAELVCLLQQADAEVAAVHARKRRHPGLQRFPTKKKETKVGKQMFERGVGRRLVRRKRRDALLAAARFGVRRDLRRQAFQRARRSLPSPENRRKVRGCRRRHARNCSRP